MNPFATSSVNNASAQEDNISKVYTFCFIGFILVISNHFGKSEVYKNILKVKKHTKLEKILVIPSLSCLGRAK